mmetsp:Transcript_26656/g.73542  ORF Transcript_26656/g.73542 Transcript_26656/m.73542 type:complete len:590 (-) Transcript_26656:2721-4490(-)
MVQQNQDLDNKEDAAVEKSDASVTATNKQQIDDYSVPVKEEFILQSRASSLPPLRTAEVVLEKEDAKKKRPRDVRLSVDEKLCPMVIRGETCQYGAEKCRFSHDIKSFLANRPSDISQIDGGCPHYSLRGHCSYGVMCRLGSSHVNMATGENLKMNPPPDNPPLPVTNNLDRETMNLLRKKKYPFKTKRHNEGGKKNKKTATNGGSDASQSAPTSISPLPAKKKLIDFSNKVYIAPLTTVGNLPFRRIMKRFGADITCGEMALSTNILQGQPSEWALLKRHPDEDIFGVQLAAGFPDVFTRVSELLEAKIDVDFVDLNLGCPLDLVCNKGAGAKLMMRERNLKGTLEGITRSMSCPVTIKMRTGWDEKKPFAHDLVKRIQSWQFGGVNAIMIHGRSRLQRYSKQADWDYVGKVAANQDASIPRVPIIGNGDIFSYKDYEEKVLSNPNLVPCAMLGRGALIKPWLPTEIKEKRVWDISSSERLGMLKDFVKYGLEHWGSDQQGVNNCRRFLLEWLSFLYRYVPVGLLEAAGEQHLNHRPPEHMCGRNELETLMLSPHCSDWIHISEMLLGPVPDGFKFEPKHKAKGYATK